MALQHKACSLVPTGERLEAEVSGPASCLAHACAHACCLAQHRLGQAVHQNRPRRSLGRRSHHQYSRVHITMPLARSCYYAVLTSASPTTLHVWRPRL